MSEIIFNKPFKTYFEMIDIMRERNIAVSDEAFAEMVLENYSYYSIVNGYKNTFLQLNDSEKFIPGTKFEELYTLHIIDTSLNNILFKYILYVEKALKSRLSYFTAENFGVYTNRLDLSNNDPDDYLYNRRYSNSNGKRDSILRKLKECLRNDRKDPCLEHYITTKNHIPPWILTYNVPFGLTIEWYTILRGIHKTEICTKFLNNPFLTTDELKEFFLKALQLLKEYRNKIAHGNRTFNIIGLPILPKKAILTLTFGNLSVSEYDHGRRGQNDIFAVFLVIMILLNDQYLLKNFYNDCWTLFYPYKEEKIKFNGKSIFEVFGLPDDILNRMERLLNIRFL